MDHSQSFLHLANEAKKRIQEIEGKDLLKDLENNPQLVLIDVREPDEWFSGHLPKALHLPRGILERDIENVIPDKSAKIVTYCGGGYRSALATDSLQNMGYQNVLSLKGGIKEWVQQSYPISKD